MESLIKNLFENLNITEHDCEIVSNNFYKRLNHVSDLSFDDRRSIHGE